MNKLLLLLLTTLFFTQTQAQFVHKIKADSVLITNDSCTAELNLENSTKHINGFLYNKGNGRTEFRKVGKLNDSTMILGEDTVAITGIFQNGLTRSGNVIKLGGALTEPTAITSSTVTSTITINGVNTNADPATINVTTSDSGGYAVQGNSSFGRGIYGTTLGGAGVYGSTNGILGTGVHGVGLHNTTTAVKAENVSNSGIGLHVLVQNGPTAIFEGNGSSTNAVNNIIRITRRTTGTAENGIDADISFLVEAINSTLVSNVLESIWVDVTPATLTSEFRIKGMLNGITSSLFGVHGSGQIKFPKYGLGTFSSTPAYDLQVDAAGNIIEVPTGGNGINTVSTTTAATVTPTPVGDIYAVTALAQNTTIAAPTGTFPDGKIIVIRIRDDGTTRTITLNSAYAAGSLFTLPASTTVGKTMYVTIIFNYATSKFDAVGYSNGH
jgi:hypothetical protein